MNYGHLIYNKLWGELFGIFVLGGLLEMYVCIVGVFCIIKKNLRAPIVCPAMGPYMLISWFCCCSRLASLLWKSLT